MSATAPEPIIGTLTHRGIVNSPECDENGHMNVQFYWARFERADAQFRSILGLDGVAIHGVRRISRHVRYHAELKGAWGLHIVSTVAHDQAGEIYILHQMVDSDRGLLSATAIDRLDVSPEVAARLPSGLVASEIPVKALPRSLSGPDPDFDVAETAWLTDGTVETCRTVIDPNLTDSSGYLTDRGFVGLSVEAAPASWSHGGFPQPRLTSLGLGRVALEKRLVINRRPRAGDLVHVLSRIIGVERVTFSVRHLYVDSRTRDFLAACDVTLLPMDLTLRKGVPLPDDVRSRMQTLASG